MGMTAVLSLAGFLSVRKRKLYLNARDGFFLVFATWVLASFIGSIPFHFAGLSFSDSLFESACTFTTTGATSIGDIEALPRSLLLWRSLAHWLGGIGIVLISVALMPLLGIGGFQLIKAEAPGPEKEKITPKITDTAKLLWLAYCVLTLTLFGLYLAGGMNWFDALCHALTCMASGGVSTKNAGIASFNSPFIEAVTTVFMLLAGLNFNLYYRLLKGKFSDIKNNTEAKVYFLIFLVASTVCVFFLKPVYGSFLSTLRYATYQSASILTTTGAAIANYENWPRAAQTVLLCLMFVGGCTGSTAGGIKVIRHVVLWKQAGNELNRLIYPRGVFNIHLNKRVGRKDVIYSVASFFFLYITLVALTTFVTASSGTNVFSSFSAALSITGNIGTGFGAVGPACNYGAFPNYVKWFYSFVMIAGRLELWTVFIMFHPAFWRR
jgi:trk system potassium uptake protein TrkH